MKPFYSIIICLMLMVACKPKSESANTDEKETSSETSTEIKLISENNGHLSEQKISEMRLQAQSILEYRKANGEGKAAILDVGVWIYKFILKGPDISKPGQYEGHWLDFKEDLTYEYGFYDEVTGSGSYFFQLDKMNLLMIDNNAAIKPQEFDVKSQADVMVLIGNKVYQDNNMQCKMDKVQSRPAR